MNPQAIIAALPWLRRLWRVLPAPLRVPVLLIAAAIGIVQFLQGRKGEGDGGGTAQGELSDARSPEGTTSPFEGGR